MSRARRIEEFYPGCAGNPQCPEPEVRAHRAANAFANFGFKRGTRFIELLVVLGFRSSYLNVPRVPTNFGIGPLASASLGGGMRLHSFRGGRSCLLAALLLSPAAGIAAESAGI